MFNVGGGELLVIMLIALIVLGPQRLPDAARQVGRVMGDLRRISSGFQQELKDAFDDTDVVTPARRKESMPLGSTVAEANRRSVRSQAGERGRANAPAPADTDDTDAARELPPARDDSTVAPAVAAALDEIVTPLDPPPAAPSDRSAPLAQAESAHTSDDDALGDERAAS